MRKCVLIGSFPLQTAKGEKFRCVCAPRCCLLSHPVSPSSRSLTHLPSLSLRPPPPPSSGTTGNFEITLGGKLVHSKKGGAGKCESDKERAAVVAAIEAALA